MTFHDAHNHLHDERLRPFLPNILEQLSALTLGRAVVNGTREDDWDSVASLARQLPWVVPSFGIHPWYVADRSDKWVDHLREVLRAHPAAAVGEIGLDRWIENHDIVVQLEVFREQLAIACELDRPVTIHCIRAWGALWDTLRTAQVPRRGFLLHAYAGPEERVRGFADRGAYFSFSAYFLHARKAAQRATFANVPLDRLLVETDAPDMAPPFEKARYQIGEAGVLNHPANLGLAYEALAATRGMPVEELAEIVAGNFASLFLA